MDIILILFYCIVGLAGLFILIVYAVSMGIDHSKSVKALRYEVKHLKRLIEETEVEKKSPGRWL